jgi:sugar phosphate isomerase/epimerase
MEIPAYHNGWHFTEKGTSMLYTRRDIARIAAAALPMAKMLGAVNSRFGGVQIGAITYSFRELSTDVDDIIKAMVGIGLGEAELMSNSVEAYAGAPSQASAGGGRARGAGGRGEPGGRQGRGPAGGRMPLTPEQQAEMRARQEELRKWRMSAPTDKFKEVRKKFDDAGIDLALLCFNMQDSITDDEVDYAFRMCKTLGAKAMTTSTTVSMSKRIAPLADKHKILVGYHGHDQTSDSNQFATLESYTTAFSYSKYNGVNLDVGHFTASDYDAIAFIREHHSRITNLHLKDRKRDHGPNVPWGQGDTPLKEILLLMKKEKYPFPGNIELEYPVPEGSNVIAEVTKCLKFCKDVLA